jgi:cytochrome c biogenesis protein CcmG/thiol:disulfide interchange protein DsbE
LIGEVSLVNVFASWCVACLQEHPLFIQLQGVVPIHGINYKDDQSDALAWLATHGDPYVRIGADRKGRVGIDWGVYGVPETYVIDRSGDIRFKQIGPITASAWRDTLWPLIQELQREQ